MRTANSDKYSFSDFTQSEYRKLIQSAKANNYKFITYDEIDKNEEGTILWRHDVDFSVHEALALAKIEHEEGVRATYFFMLHNEYYNLLERGISDLVLQIKDLGHHIQLHFDSHYYGISDDMDLAKYLIFQKSIIDQLFDVEVKAFSFHIKQK